MTNSIFPFSIEMDLSSKKIYYPLYSDHFGRGGKKVKPMHLFPSTHMGWSKWPCSNVNSRSFNGIFSSSRMKVIIESLKLVYLILWLDELAPIILLLENKLILKSHSISSAIKPVMFEWAFNNYREIGLTMSFWIYSMHLRGPMCEGILKVQELGSSF